MSSMVSLYSLLSIQLARHLVLYVAEHNAAPSFLSSLHSLYLCMSRRHACTEQSEYTHTECYERKGTGTATAKADSVANADAGIGKILHWMYS